MIVAISGKSGCGNTSLAKALAVEFKYPVFNYTYKDLAKKYGITVEDIEREGETTNKYDLEIDTKQVKYVTRKDNCIVASRLAIYVIPADLRVWIDTPDDVRYERIAQREGKTFEEAKAETSWRDDHDRERFKKWYGEDFYDMGYIDQFADLVLDGKRPIEELVGVVSCFLKAGLSARGSTIR